jgi:hypothetical protein
MSSTSPWAKSFAGLETLWVFAVEFTSILTKSVTATETKRTPTFKDLIGLLLCNLALIDCDTYSGLECGLLSRFELFNAYPQFFGQQGRHIGIPISEAWAVEELWSFDRASHLRTGGGLDDRYSIDPHDHRDG